MKEAVIWKLRTLQGWGFITPTICIYAERYIEQHPELFGCADNLTVNEAAEFAVESTRRTARTSVATPRTTRGERAPDGHAK